MWKKGQSGNPGGLTKEVTLVMRLARERCPEAFARLVELLGSEDEKIALAAANSILDRGLGKPAQAITGADGGPIELAATARVIVLPAKDEP